jgi:hypothetical protein
MLEHARSDGPFATGMVGAIVQAHRQIIAYWMHSHNEQ